MSNEKGGLIKKKKKPTLMQPAVPVKKPEMDFGYSDSAKKVEPLQKTKPVVEPAPIVEQTKIVIEPPKPTTKLSVGKSNSTKSLKVPTYVHSELNLLGSFMDENKTYKILQQLIDSYVKNELSDRQQRQFEFMVEAFNEEK